VKNPSQTDRSEFVRKLSFLLEMEISCFWNKVREAHKIEFSDTDTAFPMLQSRGVSIKQILFFLSVLTSQALFGGGEIGRVGVRSVQKLSQFSYRLDSA